MSMDKRVDTLAAAVAPIHDGSSVMIGGFGSSGIPFGLIDALLTQGASGLTIISNNAGAGETGIATLLAAGRVARVICSYPRSPGSIWFERRYEAGEIELEVVPQGTLAERIRAAGAGIGGFLTPTGYGTLLAEGKETRVIDGRGYVMESPLHADFALLRANRGDRWGNLSYHATARNFNPVMAMAAARSIAEVRYLSDGALPPETVVTPGIFVDHLTQYEVRP
jgi:3-oxoadipate CoA-transferase alpha subunit